MGQHGSDTINKTNTIYIIIALKNKNKKGRKKESLETKDLTSNDVINYQ